MTPYLAHDVSVDGTMNSAIIIEANSLQRQFVLYSGSIVSANNLWVGLIWACSLNPLDLGSWAVADLGGLGFGNTPPPGCQKKIFFFALKIRKRNNARRALYSDSR